MAPPDPGAAGRDPVVGAQDPAGMLATVEDTPRQWAHAVEVAGGLTLPERAADIGAVVVAGMGGSGIAADTAVAFAAAQGRLPVLAWKDYGLPAFAGPHTLVVAVSYSGDTEETLDCVGRAMAAGAPVLAVTSGGRLAGRSRDGDLPLVCVPAGRQPRASFAYLVVPVLLALERVGALPGIAADLRSVPGHLATLVARWGGGVPPARNPAKRAAMTLERLVPVFYGAAGWPAVAALRGKCQVNENAKRPAFWHALPELDHNEVVGWDGAPEVSGRFGLVELRSQPDERAGVARRFAATRRLVQPAVGAVVEQAVEGPSALARFAAAVLFVDLVSVYLAYLSGHDPTPVAAIDRIKRDLRDGRPAGQDAAPAP